jgi:hypothetical protein
MPYLTNSERREPKCSKSLGENSKFYVPER